MYLCRKKASRGIAKQTRGEGMDPKRGTRVCTYATLNNTDDELEDDNDDDNNDSD